MNLVEILLAGLLFSLCGAGSLQVMAGLGRSLQGSAQAELAAAQMEADLQRSQARVQAGVRQEQATDLACEQPEQLLSRWLMDPSAGDGLGEGSPTANASPITSPSTSDNGLANPSQQVPLARDVGVVAPGVVRLRLSAHGGRWQRQRLFSAAAYGLCPPGGGPLG